MVRSLVLKAALSACLQTLPLLTVWYNAQNTESLIPCSDKPCIYYKDLATRTLPSSVTDGLIKGFVVQNGEKLALPAHEYPSPLRSLLEQASAKGSDAQKHCADGDALGSVVNDFRGSLSGNFFLMLSITKAALDFSHDVFLILGRDREAIYVSIMSYLCLLTTLVAASNYCSISAELFASIGHKHVCFYRMSTFECLIMFTMPIGLAIHVLTRFANLLKSMAHGDYLFCWSDNVPIYFMQLNTDLGTIPDISSSLLVPKLIGHGVDDGAGGEREPAESYCSLVGTREHHRLFEGQMPEYPSLVQVFSNLDTNWNSCRRRAQITRGVSFIDIITFLMRAWMPMSLVCYIIIDKLVWVGNTCGAICWLTNLCMTSFIGVQLGIAVLAVARITSCARMHLCLLFWTIEAFYRSLFASKPLWSRAALYLGNILSLDSQTRYGIQGMVTAIDNISIQCWMAAAMQAGTIYCYYSFIAKSKDSKNTPLFLPEEEVETEVVEMTQSAQNIGA